MSNITTVPAAHDVVEATTMHGSRGTAGYGEAPIRVGGSSFSRPAALIGGATALIALTAIATTLVMRPAANGGDIGIEARTAAVSAQALLVKPDAATQAKTAAITPVVTPAATTSTDAKPTLNDGDEPPVVKPVPKPTPVAKPAPRPVNKTPANHSANQTAKKAAPAAAATTAAAAAGAGREATAAAACSTCGLVESVREFQQKGEGSGIGAVAGGVLGGVVGNQVGGGNGKKAMTVLGAIGGGMAGHEVEKRQRSTTMYSVTVRMEDGSVRTLTQNSAPVVGQKVTVEGTVISSRG